MPRSVTPRTFAAPIVVVAPASRLLSATTSILVGFAGVSGAQIDATTPPAPAPCTTTQFLVPMGRLVTTPGATSAATAVSEDGLWIVGVSDSSNGPSMTLWNAGTGLLSLGQNPTGFATSALDVSNTLTAIGDPTAAWFPGLPSVIDVSNLLAPAVIAFQPRAITHDALFFAGTGTSAAGASAFFVDGNGVTTINPSFPGSVALTISRASETVHLRGASRLVASLIWDFRPNGDIDAWMMYDASFAGAPTFLPGLGGSPSMNLAHAMSADASVLGGGATNTANLFEAYLWRHGIVFTLGFLPGAFDSAVRGLSGDGRAVVGDSGGRGFFLDTTVGGGIQDLIGVLGTVYGLNTTGWTSLVPADMSADGTIVGTGVFNGVTQGFIARICLPPYCYADFDKDGVVGNPNDMAEFWAAQNRNLMITDCNEDGAVGPLEINDVLCYLQRVAAGC